MFWKLMGVCGLLIALASCGGGSTPSTPSKGERERQASAFDSTYGTPQDSRRVQAMAKRLSAYFGQDNAQLTDAPATGSASSSRRTSPTASVGTKSAQQKEFLTYLRAHRFYNTATGVHFYTASDTERQRIQSTLPQFQYEGPAYKVMVGPSDFGVPVYRFYNRVTGTHLYTASETEKNMVIRSLSDIFQFEGEAWYARPGPYPGWVPVYRFYNRATGTHFYTHSETERVNVQKTLPQFALEGVAYWVRGDATVDPATWQPPAGATPSTGNYVYYESQAGDFVGQGEQHLWTATDSRLQMLNRYDTFLELSGEGDTRVGGYFFFPSSLRDWTTGFYPNATRENWMLNTSKPIPGPGLDFSMDGRGCNATTGWLYIDSVSHDPDGSLAAFEVRFEQLCQWSTDVLRGKVRWSKYDTVMPPPPLSPAPTDLWRPAAGAVPETGSLLYLEGNRVSNGVPHTYARLLRGTDSPTGRLGFAGTGMAFGGWIAETTTGNETLQFSFQTPWFLPKFVPGQYREVTRTPMMNPARGNLDFFYGKYSVPEESWACGGGQWTNGWFVVDDIGYTGDAVSRIQLRFERWCLDSQEVTRGMIRWQTGD